VILTPSTKGNLVDFRAEVKDVDKETKTLGYGQNEDDMRRMNTQDKLLMYGC
jgi:hypothetical protein